MKTYLFRDIKYKTLKPRMHTAFSVYVIRFQNVKLTLWSLNFGILKNYIIQTGTIKFSRSNAPNCSAMQRTAPVPT